MKGLKKFATILMAGMLMATMSMPVAAASATQATVKIDSAEKGVDLSDHTFTAYQIFSGTQANNSQVLGDIAWGSGIDSAKLLADAKLGEELKITVTSKTTAQDVAAALVGDDSKAKSFAEIASAYVTGTGVSVPANGSTISVDAGYWLVVDTTDVAGQDTARNASLLQVTGTGTFEIKVKTSVPSVVKKVKENETGKVTSVEAYGDDYNDVADYNIGDAVPFEFVTNVPNMSNYTNEYEYIFHDTMSKGLTFDPSSVKVYLGDTEITKGVNNPESDGQSFSLTIPNLKALDGINVDGGQQLKVTFNGTLNQNAVIGGSGNTNEVYLEYSNVPNGTGTGKTATDKVIVFTYELDTTKVDANDKTKLLSGAQFVLKATDGEHNGKYAVIDSATNRITGWADTQSGASTLTAVNGLFKVAGLDDGNYELTETKAPAGYNLLKTPVAIDLKATKNDNVDRQNFTGSTFTDFGSLAKLSEDSVDGVAKLTVENNSGSTLPSTGGIGTTIFYIIGGLMIIGAFVAFIVKRRMSAEK